MALFVSLSARRRWGLTGELLGGPGKVRLPDLESVRELSHRLGEAGAAAGQINALSLLEEILGGLLDSLDGAGDSLLDRLLAELAAEVGQEALDRALSAFAAEYLGAGEVGDGDPAPAPPATGPHRRARLRELLLFWLLRERLRAHPAIALLQDSPVLEDPTFARVAARLPALLAELPVPAPAAGSLLDFMLPAAPADEAPSPASLLRQFTAGHAALPAVEADAVGAALDVVAEEEAPRFPPGPGPAEVPSFEEEADEEERYSTDRSWMPGLVLVAKNVFVWLDQLSRQSGRPVRRLDDVPDEELATLARRGFNGLWLIGIWQRSLASRRVKQLCGNPEAEASAYSVKSYRVGTALGGEEALGRLRQRAARHGIRLAADMVPNHMGIDSDWVVEHPERFLALESCPFPSYRFTGPDLSPDPQVGIYLEDHYYDRSDAAVVFQRLDRRSGEKRYLYHGNDGTSLPWNDTAQLDYLKADVREAVIETIVDVARRFPVIRFDAAMTLARRHYRRLWFPQPGEGGAIPSRAGHGLSRRQFDELMPEEFWRQVVDRVAEECPGTLLLAEAFWLMESYFVRTLGMHRVYNSAFMNMLRDGETAKYRRLLKETLAFDPEILKRYVNFMSNPDERTAVDQFGRGDRYFGVCTVMATLPGLPMFGHGQVEGLTERYGMEYRRAYRREQPDEELVARHQRQIAPLLRRRRLFAEVEQFRLYDLETEDGEVCEEVLAYSNGAGDERVLVLFHNAARTVRGRLRRSAPMAMSTPGGDRKRTVRQSLAAALGVRLARRRRWLRFRDEIGGLDYLQPTTAVTRRGLAVELGPFEARVLGGFEVVADDRRGLLQRLAAQLDGAGVPSLDEALRRLEVEALPPLLGRAFPPALLRRLAPDRLLQPAALADDLLLDELTLAAASFAEAAASRHDLERTRPRLLAAITLPFLADRLASSRRTDARRAGTDLRRALIARPGWLPALVLGIALDGARDLESLLRPAAGTAADPAWLAPGLAVLLHEAGMVSGSMPNGWEALLVGWSVGWGRRAAEPPDAVRQLSDEVLEPPLVRRFLGTHEGDGSARLHRESLEELLDARLVLETLARNAGGDERSGRIRGAVTTWSERLAALRAAAQEAG